MQAWYLDSRFGIDALTLGERPLPTPASHEVLVKVHAAALNFHDLMVVEGRYTPPPALPIIPVADGAGEVVAIGTEVTRVRVGDRVSGNFAQRWVQGRTDLATIFGSTLGSPRDGFLAEYVLLEEQGTVVVPPHLSFEEASTLPIAGVTAWHALLGDAPLHPGETVLVQGTGGVAVFAIQLARAAGAEVLVTTTGPAKARRALQIGAHHAIDRQETPAWDARVLELTSGVGVDLVVDVAGGDLNRSIRAVRWGGRISVVGLLASPRIEFDVIGMMTKKVRLQGIAVGPREMFEDMNRALTRHMIRPIVHAGYDFGDAQAAFRDLARGEHVGKLVIRGPTS